MRALKKIVTIFLILTVIAVNLWSQENEKPYVILISFDGFRWDFVNKGITPNLEKIKNTGSSALSLRPVFPSKTFPNHYSIITGLYPVNHGIIHNDFYNLFTGERYKVGEKNRFETTNGTPAKRSGKQPNARALLQQAISGPVPKCSWTTGIPLMLNIMSTIGLMSSELRASSTG